MVGYEEHHHVSEIKPDPFIFEIDHLKNQLKEKVKEIATCKSEIKALKATESLKDVAIEQLRSEVNKVEEKLRITEDIVERKNLEIKRLNDEKKDALAAQFAAETSLRKLQASQKEEECVPVQTVIAPLEAQIKMYKKEITGLQEDKKALERLTKSKEVALLEAEGILRSALERVLIVEEVQNQNFDLRRQIEICQEENKILEKRHRQKVVEVEKLGQTIEKLEEAILAGGGTANAVRDYRRQISELQEEKRRLEREVTRMKVSTNSRENDKAMMMPVKQWFEERKVMQAEIQRMKDKLVTSERTAKAESQLKDKLKLRLKTLEEGMKNSSPKLEKSNMFGFLTTNGTLRKRPTSQPRVSSSTSKVSNGDGGSDDDVNDLVSGFLYDKLQKEVISLRNQCGAKDTSLMAKDEEIKMLVKKVEAMSKAVEIERKKSKREAAVVTAMREKESQTALTKADNNKKHTCTILSKR